MAAGGSRFRNPRAWSFIIAIGMFAVVLAFVASTVLMHARLNATVQALSVASNGGPSVRFLAAARTHLRQEREAAGAYVFRSGGAGAQTAMRQARHRLDAALAAERTTPSYPGEKSVNGEVQDALRALDEVTGTLRPSPDINDARRSFLAYQASVDQLDDRIAQLEDHNATYLVADAGTLLAKQRSATSLIFLLDGISILLAVGVTGVLIVFLRDYHRVMEQRQHELEMFSARVAHDLMSPLGTVSIALGTNAKKLRDEGSLKMNQSALAALRRARTVVDGLLDFARAGGHPAPNARAPVAEVIAGVLEDARPVARAAGIELISEPFAPCEVACEPGVLTVLVSNLLNNAIKFMDESEVRCIEVRAQGDSRRVRVEVEDTGPGFPRGFEAIIFDPYARATTRAPGLGLGLATVRRLVDAHGGQVGVVRREGVGTLFWFELPGVPH